MVIYFKSSFADTWTPFTIFTRGKNVCPCYLQLKHFTILSPQGPVVTDNSNFIVDCLFDKVDYYLGIFSALD